MIQEALRTLVVSALGREQTSFAPPTSLPCPPLSICSWKRKHPNLISHTQGSRVVTPTLVAVPALSVTSSWEGYWACTALPL